MNLGKIKKVPLREIWKHEATNFTNWLSKSENLDLLSDEINIDLSLIDTEYNVGRFNVDIFAEESNTERKVIIENQLEKTDHDHLGKLITYASGLDAEVIIWIVKDVLEEHQQAISWLNENTSKKINFFAIQMEVWQIGNSEPAPRFNIVTKPNNWTKSVKQSSQNVVLTETKKLQLKFWDHFKNYSEDNNIGIKLRKTYPQHWYDISFGRSDCHIALTVNSQTKEIGCEIYIPDAKETFHLFYKNKIEIDNKIKNLEWLELPNKKASRIKKLSKQDFKKESNWNTHFAWLTENALQFQGVFRSF